MPTVSVLMPVYNGEKYLRQAIDSILTQTYRDFELVILNDGSTDGSAQIIDSYDDPRIKVINQPENLGLTETLNRAIDSHLASRYLARMDQDDISLPHRLEHQVAYMKAHPTVGVLATNVRFMNEVGEFVHAERYPAEVGGDYLRWRLHWENPIIHSSVMIRSDVLALSGIRFDPRYFAADDYHFWLQLLDRGVHIDLLNEVCLHYRFVPSSMSRKNREIQLGHAFEFIQGEVKKKATWASSPLAVQTLAAHFALRALPQYDYAGAARTLIQIALRHIHCAGRPGDRTRIYGETQQILDAFIEKSDAVTERQIRIIKLLFRVYVRLLSNFVRRLIVFTKTKAVQNS